MKKMIIALGAIACAFGLQAASLNWTVTAVQAATSGDDLSTYTALLYFTDGAGTVGSTFSTVSKDDVIASLTGTSVLAGYSHSANLNASGAVGGATGLSSNFGAGDSLTGFAVILDGSINDYSNYIVTDSITATWTSSSGAKMMGFGSQASATWTAAVPEPTSGLLMLVGLAGLALRRRRA